jgi:hypothetical protein
MQPRAPRDSGAVDDVLKPYTVGAGPAASMQDQVRDFTALVEK